MKAIRPLLLSLALLAATGCLTTHVVRDKARPHLEYHAADRQLREAPGEPGYYALLPLTVAGDAATLPFQALYFLWTDDAHRSAASYHGIPIPLP